MKNPVLHNLESDKIVKPGEGKLRLVDSWTREKKYLFIEARFEEYITFLQRSRRPENTIRGFRQCLNHIRIFNKSAKIRNYDLQPKFWEDYASFLINEMNYTNSSARVYIERFHTVLGYAHIAYNHELPRFYFNREAKHQIKDEIFTDEEIEQIWQCQPPTPGLKALRDKTLVSLYTGCRLSEVNSVFSSLDKDGNKVCGYYAQKDHEPRYVAMHPRIEPLIKSENYKTLCNLPLMFKYFRDMIEFKGRGLEITRQGGKVVRRMIPRSEIVTFHSARKTFAVRMIEAGMDVYALSNLLGHSSIKTTMEYYALIRDKKLTEKTQDAFKSIK